MVHEDLLWANKDSNITHVNIWEIGRGSLLVLIKCSAAGAQWRINCSWYFCWGQPMVFFLVSDFLLLFLVHKMCTNNVLHVRMTDSWNKQRLIMLLQTLPVTVKWSVPACSLSLRIFLSFKRKSQIHLNNNLIASIKMTVKEISRDPRLLLLSSNYLNTK